MEITEEDNKTYKLNSGVKFKMKCNGTLSNFVKLILDGKNINSSNYEKESGSTVISFKNTYLDSLDVGTHKIAFVYNDGRKAEINLTIVEETIHTEATSEDTQDTDSSSEISTNTPTDSTTDDKAKNTVDKIETTYTPKTGDSITVYVSLMLLSIIGIFGTIKFSKKKDKQK